MKLNKLNEDSLQEAVELVTSILHQAVDDGEVRQFALPDGEGMEYILEDWELLILYGDLDNTEDNFGEFVWQYNENHGLD